MKVFIIHVWDNCYKDGTASCPVSKESIIKFSLSFSFFLYFFSFFGNFWEILRIKIVIQHRDITRQGQHPMSHLLNKVKPCLAGFLLGLVTKINVNNLCWKTLTSSSSFFPFFFPFKGNISDCWLELPVLFNVFFCHVCIHLWSILFTVLYK